MKQEKCIQVTDANGELWDVKEARPTKHGFDVLYGRRVSCHPMLQGGSLKLIVTKELAQFWEDSAIKHDGTMSDLPIPATTRKRARRRYGFNYFHDIAQFYEEHMDDLKTLSGTKFAKKHDLPVHKVSGDRLKILGRRARPVGWWKEPKVVEALLSQRTLCSVAREFGIGTSQTHRLRRAAQALQAAA